MAIVSIWRWRGLASAWLQRTSARRVGAVMGRAQGAASGALAPQRMGQRPSATLTWQGDTFLGLGMDSG